MTAVDAKVLDRKLPSGIICLVVATLVCHILVFVGSLQFNANIKGLGKSTDGWSNVGVSFAKALQTDLDQDFFFIQDLLTNTVSAIQNTTIAIEDAISIIANVTDNVMEVIQKLLVDEASRQQGQTSIYNAAVKILQAIVGECQGATLEISGGELEVVSIYGTGYHTISGQARQTGATHRTSGALCGCVARGQQVISGHHRHVGMCKQESSIAAMLDERNDTIMMKATKMLNAAMRLNATITPSATMTINALVNLTMQMLRSIIDPAVETVKASASRFIEIARPALVRAGELLVKFNEESLDRLEEIMVTIDRTLTIFDSIIDKVSLVWQNATATQAVLKNTFFVFDLDNSGFVTAQEIEGVSELYVLTAFMGEKGRELLVKYDDDRSASLTLEEFARLSQDESVPNCLGNALRQYAKRLSQVAGSVAAARQRSEVAHTFVEYLDLVCAANTTMMGWMAHALSNGSLPIEFTAEVMRDLAENFADPSAPATADTGQILIAEMLRLNATYVHDAFDLMQDPSWWQGAGHQLVNQPGNCAIVLRWIVLAGEILRRNGTASHAISGKMSPSDSSQVERWMRSQRWYHDLMDALDRRISVFEDEMREMRINSYRARLSSPTAQALYVNLLGKPVPASQPMDPDVYRVTKTGLPAKMETLVFAQFLAANASQLANSLQEMSFESSSTSGNPVDSFGSMLIGVTKTATAFLNLLKKYATPLSLDEIDKQLQAFMNKSIDDVVLVVESIIEDRLTKAMTSIVGNRSEADSLLAVESRALPHSSQVWASFVDFQDVMNSVLPSVLAKLEFSRKEASKFTEALLSVFGILNQKGAPIFYVAAAVHRSVMTVYFVLFMLLTLIFLLYGFWSAGWLGDVPADHLIEYQPPRSFSDRVWLCCACCCACGRGCHDKWLCLWSYALLMQVIILLLFLSSMILWIVSGVQALLRSGCSVLYVLNDPDWCYEGLVTIKRFVSSFWTEHAPTVMATCRTSNLLTCQIITSNFVKSMIFTGAGSVLATILASNLLLESARRHELARWRALAADLVADPEGKLAP